VTDSQPADRALAETAAGAVQGGGEQDATDGPRPDAQAGASTEDEFDAGEFVLDHDADPPEEVQPTTS
jgi:hypothetical protein